MTTATTQETNRDIFRLILSLILPPIGVAMQVGITGQFWLNVLLTLFGYLPGVIHAAYIISTRNG